MDTSQPQSEYFQLSWHGDCAVIIPSPEVETMPENLIEPAAEIVLSPLRKEPPSNLIVDLSGVPYFGSAFIRFLLKCHMVVRPSHSELVLAGCSPKVRELLHVMNFDTLWAIYDTRAEALAALSGSD